MKSIQKIKYLHTLRRSFDRTPTAVHTKRIESRATRVRLSKSSVFIEQSTSTDPIYYKTTYHRTDELVRKVTIINNTHTVTL